MASNSLAEPENAYQGLLYNVFQRLRKSSNRGLVVALTSANAGEGVSYVAGTLMREIEKTTEGLLVDLEWLEAQPPSALSGDGMADRGEEMSISRWKGSLQYRRERIEELGSRYPYVLIECPALATSGDVFSLATSVDGFLLVVEANRTRKQEIRNAERQLTSAGGKLLGHVLNKRTYDIPHWLYKHL